MREVLLVAGALGVEVVIWGRGTEVRWGGSWPIAPVLAVIALVFAALAWRRRHPRVVYAVTWVYTVAGAAVLPRFEPFVALFVMLFYLSRHSRTVIARVALATTAVPLLLNSYNAYVLQGELSGFLMPMLMWVLLAVGIWGVGRAIYRVEQRARRRERAYAEESAAALAAERSRLARDLHDILAHSVSAMILQAAGARAIASKADVQASDARIVGALGAIENAGAQAMRELHRLLGLLRSQEAADSQSLDFLDRPSIATIDRLVELTRESGQSVRVQTLGDPVELDASVDIAAYRVVQESLSNAMRHGGRDGTVDLGVDWRDDRLEVRVRSIPGFRSDLIPVESGGFGLRGLRERVELVGGTFEAGSVDGDFLTAATFPLATTDRHTTVASVPTVAGETPRTRS